MGSPQTNHKQGTLNKGYPQKDGPQQKDAPPPPQKRGVSFQPPPPKKKRRRETTSPHLGSIERSRHARCQPHPKARALGRSGASEDWTKRCVRQADHILVAAEFNGQGRGDVPQRLARLCSASESWVRRLRGVAWIERANRFGLVWFGVAWQKREVGGLKARKRAREVDGR